MRIVSVSSTQQPASRPERLLKHVERRVHEHGLPVQRLNLRDLPARALLAGDGRDRAIAQAAQAVAGADVVLLATTVERACLDGGMACLLALLPPDALRDTLVLPLVTAPNSRQLMAATYVLLPVLSELGAREVLEPVQAVDVELPQSSDGCLVLPALGDRLEQVSRTLVARLLADRAVNRLRSAPQPAGLASASARG